MKKKAYIVWTYAFILFIGGLMGFIIAGSLISLFVSAGFALALSLSGYGIWKGSKSAYDITIGIVSCLLAFFVYRFLMTFQNAPAGVMTLLSGLLLGFLLTRKNSQKNFE